MDRQRAGAAAEVDDPSAGHGRHEVEQVEEWLGPLVSEALVLVRLPGVAHDADRINLYTTCL